MPEICPFDKKIECDPRDVRYSQSGDTFQGIIINGKTLTAGGERINANYTAYVCNLAKEKSRMVISNTDANHAKIVLSNLLKSAKKNVKIYCSEQDIEFFNRSDNNLRKVFHTFLMNLQSIQVEVLLDGCSDSSIKMLKKLSIPSQIKIKVISSESRRQMKYDIGIENDFHILVVDDEAYRFEYDTVKHAAICSFNDKSQCKQMRYAFNRAFCTSRSLL